MSDTEIEAWLVHAAVEKNIPAAVIPSMDARTKRNLVRAELVRKPIDLFKGQVSTLKQQRIEALEDYSDTIVCGLYWGLHRYTATEGGEASGSSLETDGAEQLCPMIAHEVMSVVDDSVSWRHREAVINGLTESINDWAFEQGVRSDAAKQAQYEEIKRQKAAAIEAAAAERRKLREELSLLLQPVLSAHAQQQVAIDKALQVVRDGPSEEQITGFTVTQVNEWFHDVAGSLGWPAAVIDTMDLQTKKKLLMSHVVSKRVDDFKGLVKQTAKARKDELQAASNEVIFGLCQWISIESGGDVPTGLTRIEAVEVLKQNISAWKHMLDTKGSEAATSPSTIRASN